MLGAIATSYVVRYDPSEHRDEYSFIARDFDGDPVRWNPCEPVHYVVNVADAPAGSLGDVQEAVRRISAATGITFAYDGLTDEVLERRRDMVQSDLYGEGWAPVLVVWVDPDISEVSFRSGDRRGRRGRVAVHAARQRRDRQWMDRDQRGRPEPAGFRLAQTTRGRSCSTSGRT